MTVRRMVSMAALAGVMGLMSVLGLLASFALPSSAQADNPVKIENTSTQTIRIGKATFSGEEFARGEITILSDMNLRAGVKINRKNCITTKPGQIWWSGGWGMNGRAFEKETTPGTLCRSKKSKTGWVKVGGGKTGRKCFNEAKVGNVPPGLVAKGRIIWVSSFAEVKMHVKAHEKFKITAICGEASGEATAEIRLTLRVVMNSRGSVVKKFFANVKADAWVTAKGKLECVPVVTQPPATTTVVTTTTPTTTTVVTTTTTTTTTPPANQKPVPSIPTQHSEFTLYKREVCGTARDQEDQNNLNVWFTAERGGVIPGSTRKIDAVTWCFMYQAPPTAGTDRITIHVLDGRNPEQTATSNPFEIRTAP